MRSGPETPLFEIARGDEPLAGSGLFLAGALACCGARRLRRATPTRSATCSSRPASAPPAQSRRSSSRRAARQPSTTRRSASPAAEARDRQAEAGVTAAEAEMDAYRTANETRPGSEGGRRDRPAAAAAGRAGPPSSPSNLRRRVGGRKSHPAAMHACVTTRAADGAPPTPRPANGPVDARISPHQASAALRLRAGQQDQGAGARRRRRHHRPRHGQPGPAGAGACRPEAVRDRRQAAHRPLLGLQGHRRPAPRPGGLLRPPLRREAQSRDPGRRDARLEGGLRQHGAGDHRRRATSCSCPTRATRSTPSAS